MPEFAPSSVHKATVTFSNPKSAGFDYQASLCMGTGWIEMATASFHIDAGQSKAIQFSITMPSAQGTYPVYFKVYSGGVLIGTFVAKEDVVIAAPAVGVDHFDSCEVPSQISRGTLPYPDLPISSTEEFFAKHIVYLTVSPDKLYTFELLASTEGVTLNPAEYARPWYGIDEDMVRYMWERTHYLPTPVQRTQLFPVETEGFYIGRGVSNWGQTPWAAALQWNISSVTVFGVMATPPRGVYKIISRCSIVPCKLELTGIPEYPYTIRTWGQWVTLWEVDTGKTIKIV